MPNPRDLADLLATIRRVKPAFFNGVPTLYIALLNHPRRAAAARSTSSRSSICFSGAAPLLADTKTALRSADRRAHRRRLFADRSDDGAVRQPGEGREQDRLGRHAAARRHVRIFDADEGTRELPANEVGEIAIAAPQLMIGFWNRPEETALVLRDHVDDGGTRRWLHTGDLGYLDDDGYLFIVDRKKDLIKTSGYQVWPREIEEVLAAHPAVAEVGVAGVPDAIKGEAVKAWVVLRAGTDGDRSGAARVLPRAAGAVQGAGARSSSARSCRRRWSARCCGARSREGG